jgi:hypothetical protein
MGSFPWSFPRHICGAWRCHRGSGDCAKLFVDGWATIFTMTVQGRLASVWSPYPVPRAAVTALAHRRWIDAILGFMLCGLLCGLAGCGMSDGAGALFVDPGRYTLYRCEDLAARRKVLVAREAELRGLIEKASESPGGAVVGSLAYRSEYDSVLAEQKLLQRKAEEKNCGFVAPSQSDQVLR